MKLTTWNIIFRIVVAIFKNINYRYKLHEKPEYRSCLKLMETKIVKIKTFKNFRRNFYKKSEQIYYFLGILTLNHLENKEICVNS
jgi:hypothetical protein